MANDLTNTMVNSNDKLTEEQAALFEWRDYLLLLRDGIESRSDNEPHLEKAKVDTWLQVIVTELEGDIMHIQSGNDSKFRRFHDPKRLSKMDSNISV